VKKKTVLVCGGVNRRPITFVSESGTTDVQKVEENVFKIFADVLDDGVSLLIQVSIAIAMHFEEETSMAFCSVTDSAPLSANVVSTLPC